jgi:plastocyanin
MPNRYHLGRRVRALVILVAALGALTVATALAASAKTVKVADSYYGPKTLSVGRGTTVTWRWAGSLLHNVKVRVGPVKFKSRTQIHGTYSHTFSTRGTYKLYCTLHPNMTMTVVVH